MTPDAFKEVCDRFKYPKTTFSFARYGWEADIWVFTIQIAGVEDMFTGEIGPLTFRFMFTDKSLLVYDEKDAKEWIHTKLQELLVHEMNEQLEYGDDRPWYPHGPWADRKHLTVKRDVPEWLSDATMSGARMQMTLSEQATLYYRKHMETLYEDRVRQLIEEAAPAYDVPPERSDPGELRREVVTETTDSVPRRVGSQDREVAGG